MLLAKKSLCGVSVGSAPLVSAQLIPFFAFHWRNAPHGQAVDPGAGADFGLGLLVSYTASSHGAPKDLSLIKELYHIYIMLRVDPALSFDAG